MKRLFSTPKRCVIVATVVLLIIAAVTVGLWVSERQAVWAAIEDHGGSVTSTTCCRVHYDGNGSPAGDFRENPLARILGHRSFRSLHAITSISFSGRSLTDDELSQVLNQFPRPERIHTLRLADTSITGEGLRELSELPRLQFLFLSGTPITDAGIKHLRQLPELRRLDLSNTQISDAGIKHLRKIPRLEILHLSNTRVTDRGMEHLVHLRQLAVLLLDGTEVTDAGMKPLAKLPRLDVVDASNTGVTDEGLRILKKGQPQVSVYDD